MKLRRKVAAIMILTTTLVIVEAAQPAAQDAPPDLHMLMNLDLFASRSGGRNGTTTPGMPAAPGADDSMFAQIRALNAMGYLGDDAEPAKTTTPRNTSDESVPSSQPTYSVEDQQP